MTIQQDIVFNIQARDVSKASGAAQAAKRAVSGGAVDTVSKAKGGGMLSSLKGIGGAEGMGGALKSITGLLGGIAIKIASLLGIALGFAAIIMASKSLQKTLSSIGRVLLLFLKPIGDIISTLLRPLIWILLPMARSFNMLLRPMRQALAQQMRDARKGGGLDLLKNILPDFGSMPTIEELMSGEKDTFDFAKWINNNISKFIPTLVPFNFLNWIIGYITELFTGERFNLADWIIDRLRELVHGTFEFNTWMLGAIGDLFLGAFVFKDWLSKTIKEYFTGAFVFKDWFIRVAKDYFKDAFIFKDWMLQNISRLFLEPFSFNTWFSRMVGTFITGSFNIGTWLNNTASRFISGFFNFGSWLSSNISRFIGGVGNIGSNFLSGVGGMLGFNDFIARPGMGVAHFNPNDTVIGVKNTNDLFSGNNNSGRSVNISMNVTINAMDGNDMKRKMDELIRDNLRKYA